MDLLQRRGAVAESLPVAPKFLWVDLSKVVRDPALIAKVKAAKGIFFTGGVQERIVDVLQPGGQSTPMLEAIWDVYRKGGVVAGTSGGCRDHEHHHVPRCAQRHEHPQGPFCRRQAGRTGAWASSARICSSTSTSSSAAASAE